MNRLAELISEYVNAHQAEYVAWLSSQKGGEENEVGRKRGHHENEN